MKQISLYFKDSDLELHEYISKLSKENRNSLNQTILKIIEEHKKRFD